MTKDLRCTDLVTESVKQMEHGVETALFAKVQTEFCYSVIAYIHRKQFILKQGQRKVWRKLRFMLVPPNGRAVTQFR